MTAEISLREANVEDLEQICRIERRSFSDPYPRDLLRMLIVTSHVFLVAELKNGGIAGYVCGLIENMQNARVGHIVSIAVDPSFRHRGIGTRLLREAILRLKERGAKSVILECRESNIVAMRLYEKLGFKKVCRIPHYYEDGEDAIVFKLDL